MDSTKQLGGDNISELLIKFSIPAIIGMLVNGLYNIVDRIFIGQGVNSLGIAGNTISFPIMSIMMAFSMLVGVGATALISIRLGENKKDEAEVIIGNSVTLFLIISIIITILGLIFLEPLLILFGADASTLPYAMDYMSVILLGTLPATLGFGMNNFIRADGNPKIAMYTMLIGAIINVFLDYVFIFIFHWGMKGAALATIISHFVSAIWVLYYFFSGSSVLKIKFKNFRLKFKIVTAILAIGFGPFAIQMTTSLSHIVINTSLEHYGGAMAIAAMGVTNSYNMIIQMPVLGISQGCQPIIGYNFGAKKYDRVIKTLKLGIFAGTVIMIIGFVANQLFATQIVALFNNEDPHLIDFGAKALRTYLFLMPLVGFQIIGGQYFQAVGKPKIAMISSLSRQLLFLIPLVLVLPRYFGKTGVLYAGPISDFLSGLLVFFFLTRELRNLTEAHSHRLVLEKNFIN